MNELLVVALYLSVSSIGLGIASSCPIWLPMMFSWLEERERRKRVEQRMDDQ